MPTPLTLNWDEFLTAANDPGDVVDDVTSEISDNATLSQDTGGIQVGVTYTNEGNIANNGSAEISTSTQFVDTAAGETFDTNSGLRLNGQAGDLVDTATVEIDFTAVAGSGFNDEVENVAFRLNDIDASSWRDVVTIRAYDADGNLINVEITFDGVTTSGTSATVLADEASGNLSEMDEDASALVEIAGPVARIEIDYDNDNATSGQFLWVTDIQFDAVDAIPLDGTVSGTSGDDIIDESYIGDLEGDMVDNGDAILAGDTGDDDLIFGFAGDDTISAGLGDDEIFGGSGDDTIDGGLGDDVIFGDEGDGATGLAGLGSDTINISENEGTDTITGGESPIPADIQDVDTIDFTDDTGTDGVDVTLTGDEAGEYTFGTDNGDGTFSEIEAFDLTDQDDTFDGAADTTGIVVDSGAGNDELTGGTGVDSLSGGDGNDTVTFGDGDSVDGGSGDDLLVLGDLNPDSNGTITITGGSGDETEGDTLQLGGQVELTQDIIDTFVDDGTGSFSGSIELDDGTILNFSEIENIICFTPGTRIATPNGLVAIENLKVGDLVVTRDQGLQPIRWFESRTVPAVDRFAPVRIRKNVLAGQDRDLIVSPQHRVLFQGYQAELLFGEREVLVSAKHLIDGMDVTQDEQPTVTYIHIMFDSHQVIYAEGAATESFHPGDIGMTAVSDQAREELFAIFPELRADQSVYGNTARRCLKAHEAKLIKS